MGERQCSPTSELDNCITRKQSQFSRRSIAINIMRLLGITLCLCFGEKEELEDIRIHQSKSTVTPYTQHCLQSKHCLKQANSIKKHCFSCVWPVAFLFHLLIYNSLLHLLNCMRFSIECIDLTITKLRKTWFKLFSLQWRCNEPQTYSIGLSFRLTPMQLDKMKFVWMKFSSV